MADDQATPAPLRRQRGSYLPEESDETRSGVNYPRSGADAGVSDPAFALDDTSPTLETADAAVPEREHPDFSDARRGSDPADDPINAPYPGNDLLPPPHGEREALEDIDDEDDSLRADTAEWLENQTPERGRPAQVEERRNGGSGETAEGSR